MKSPIGLFCESFSRKHSRGIFIFSSKGEYPSGIRERSWEILKAAEANLFIPVQRFRHGYFRNGLMAERVAIVSDFEVFVAYLINMAFAFKLMGVPFEMV